MPEVVAPPSASVVEVVVQGGDAEVQDRPRSSVGRGAAAPADPDGWRPYAASVTADMTGCAYVCGCGAQTFAPGQDGWEYRADDVRVPERRCAACRAAATKPEDLPLRLVPRDDFAALFPQRKCLRHPRALGGAPCRYVGTCRELMALRRAELERPKAGRDWWLVRAPGGAAGDDPATWSCARDFQAAFTPLDVQRLRVTLRARMASAAADAP